jgi:hypothetical protein
MTKTQALADLAKAVKADRFAVREYGAGHIARRVYLEEAAEAATAARRSGASPREIRKATGR